MNKQSHSYQNLCEEARWIIDHLSLEPHILEGGFFCETYRGLLSVEVTSQSDRPTKSRRSISTAIYYLITKESFSAFHRLSHDEVFHFYQGDPVELQMLKPNGEDKRYLLGQDLVAGQTPQLVVPAHVWQGSRLQAGGRYALLGTTVAPGFDESDFELAEYDHLIQAYPHAKAWIEQHRQ